MNTKTDQISSGLVAHIAAFKEALNGTRGDFDAWLECNDESEVRQAIFGVISDAEAIVAAKDAEIAAWKNDAINGGNAGYLREVAEQQAERIKELKTEFDGCSELLDNAERIMEQQSAALKLASLALSEGVEYVEEPPEKNCTCHLAPPCNDCVEHSAVREFFIDARKALAAIDALGE